MTPPEPAQSQFVIMADVWDYCASRWVPGKPVTTLKSVKCAVTSVYREGMQPAAWKAAAISRLRGTA